MGSQWSHGHARPECFHGSGECASALSLGDVAFYVPIVGAAKQHIPPKSSSSDGQHSLARVVGVAHSVGLRRVTTLWSYGAREWRSRGRGPTVRATIAPLCFVRGPIAPAQPGASHQLLQPPTFVKITGSRRVLLLTSSTQGPKGHPKGRIDDLSKYWGPERQRGTVLSALCIVDFVHQLYEPRTILSLFPLYTATWCGPRAARALWRQVGICGDKLRSVFDTGAFASPCPHKYKG